MSMKEYELLREKYAQKKEYNYYDNNNYNNENENNNKEYNNKDNDEKDGTLIKKSHTFDIKDNIKNNQEIPRQKEEFIYNNLYDPGYDNHIHNMGIKHYNWDEYENNNQISSPLINNGNKIINENLFKRNNYKRRHSLYGKYNSDKNVKGNLEMNYFNNKILQNKNWGNDNDINKYRVGRKSFTYSMKKNEGINMRTRKKI